VKPECTKIFNTPTMTEQGLSDLFVKQEQENLVRIGYIMMNAKAPFFMAILRAIQHVHPDARAIAGVGPHCNRQVIYLPSSKRHVLTIINGEMREYRKALAGSEASLRSLNAPPFKKWMSRVRKQLKEAGHLPTGDKTKTYEQLYRSNFGIDPYTGLVIDTREKVIEHGV
jgi:hypothetical protein